jgi:hypothetical protein
MYSSRAVMLVDGQVVTARDFELQLGLYAINQIRA